MPRPKKKPKEPGDVGSLSVSDLRSEDSIDEESILVDTEKQVDENDNLAVAIIKMKLNSFVCNLDLRAKINSIVIDMNIVIGEAYLFANFHILRIISEGSKPIPVIDRNFYYKCIMAVSNNNCRVGTLGEDIAESVIAFDALRQPLQEQEIAESPLKSTRKSKSKTKDARKVDISELNQVVADAAIVMATMATNHLWINLASRLKGYIRWKYPTMRPKMRALVAQAVAEEPKKPLDKIFIADAKRQQEVDAAKKLAEELRLLAPLRNNRQFASHAFLTLPLYYKIQSEMQEAWQENRRLQGLKLPKVRGVGRPFTLLPLKNGFTISHIQFSKMALLGIMKKLKLVTFAGDGRDENARTHWDKFFDLKKVETRTRKFKDRIVTDGCAVSVITSKMSCLTCPTSCNCDNLKDLVTGRDVTVVGVDPGVTDVVTVAFKDGKVKSYSAARYYEAAMYNTSNRRTQHWNAETESRLKAADVSAAGFTTSSMAAFSDSTRAYLEVIREMTKHRANRGYRNMRFMRYVHKKKAIKEICDMIAPPKDDIVIVGFGDWKGIGGGPSALPIKRRCTGPLQEIKFELASRKNTMMRSVWEYLTSKTCHGCFQELCNMKAKQIRFKRQAPDEKGIRKLVRVEVTGKVHKVLHCKSSQDGGQVRRCGTTWNRDVNAAKNILMLLMFEVMGIPRPSEFKPGPKPSSKRVKEKKK